MTESVGRAACFDAAVLSRGRTSLISFSNSLSTLLLHGKGNGTSALLWTSVTAAEAAADTACTTSCQAPGCRCCNAVTAALQLANKIAFVHDEPVGCSMISVGTMDRCARAVCYFAQIMCTPSGCTSVAVAVAVRLFSYTHKVAASTARFGCDAPVCKQVPAAAVASTKCNNFSGVLDVSMTAGITLCCVYCGLLLGISMSAPAAALTNFKIAHFLHATLVRSWMCSCRARPR